ncbi:unnamed protein product [Blepharisma stoltei]|uniref:Uncharacterized protein n=1 Tax=Blepharisma stoltei TaxID=1481888 RepID=A0AAU9IXG0_9CILI|nr:unnamed protein product [Blepharisma stoltei]
MIKKSIWETPSNWKSRRESTGFVSHIVTRRNPKPYSESDSHNLAKTQKRESSRSYSRKDKVKELLKILQFIEKHYSTNKNLESAQETSYSTRDSQKESPRMHTENIFEAERLPLIRHGYGGIIGFENDLKARLCQNKRNSINGNFNNNEKAYEILVDRNSGAKKSFRTSKYILLPKSGTDSTIPEQGNKRQIEQNAWVSVEAPKVSIRKVNKLNKSFDVEDLASIDSPTRKNRRKNNEKSIEDEGFALIGWEVGD